MLLSQKRTCQPRHVDVAVRSLVRSGLSRREGRHSAAPSAAARRLDVHDNAIKTPSLRLQNTPLMEISTHLPNKHVPQLNNLRPFISFPAYASPVHAFVSQLNQEI